MAQEKVRLDMLLVERGLFPSRERARAAIMAGQVYVGGVRADKAGEKVSPDAAMTIKGDKLPYVSRGGLKLAKALDVFRISCAGKVAMDVGASTGGFTDCLLQNGAAKVYAVDVGYGQLAWSLRNDPRVVNMERTNIRYVTPQQIPEPLDLITVDVAFISLALVFPPAANLLKAGGEMVALIKPQFEAGREKVGKKGVVRDPAVHREVIERVITQAPAWRLFAVALTYSPIKGPEGNIEYLLYLKKEVPGTDITPADIAAVVEEAHRQL